MLGFLLVFALVDALMYLTWFNSLPKTLCPCLKKFFGSVGGA